MRILRDHPIIGIISTFVFLGSVWNLFSEKAPAPALWRALTTAPIVTTVAVLASLIAAATLYFAATRPPFYENRSDLDRRGGLKNELKGGNEFWAIGPAGHAIGDMQKELQKIKRLILGNPNSSDEIMKRHARHFGSANVEHVREVIRHATQHAREQGVLVKWTEERSISILISEPESTTKKGWARIEFIMPFLPGSSRPSFVISQRWQPCLFAEMVKAFNDLWTDPETIESNRR